MKKALILAAVAVSFTMVSCKKDYTCTCSGTDVPAGTKFEYSKVKKDDAEAACSTQETNLRTVGYADASCSI